MTNRLELVLKLQYTYQILHSNSNWPQMVTNLLYRVSNNSDYGGHQPLENENAFVLCFFYRKETSLEFLNKEQEEEEEKIVVLFR